jgi:hypothetical protein
MKSTDGYDHRDPTTGTPSATSGLCRVFVSYSRADEAQRVRLDVHLAPLVREGLIDLWSDRAIAPGSDWERDIEQELATADIVLLLVTPDFVASVYCFDKELAEALRRHEEDGVRILPVLVKPVDLRNMPFCRFQALPKDLRTISAWHDADEAWLQVAQGVRDTVEEIYHARTDFPVPRTESTTISDKTRLGQELQDYYGASSCVIDGPVAEDRGVDWIPLDENSEAMRFDNLVPISSRHRTRPAGTVGRATFRFGIDLIAENLFHSARRHFHAGVPALAFGCARLGDILAAHYPYAFEIHEGDDWAFLAQSLFYLPYRRHAALLEATLLRLRRRLAINSNCPNAGRSALLLAVANLCQDVGAWARAEELYDQVLASKPAPFIQIATLRRRAVGRIFLGATAETMARDFRRVGDYETNADLAVSLAISQGWWHLSCARPEHCLRQLEPFDFDEEASCVAASYSPHNAIELKLTQASALIALGLSGGSQIRFVAGRARGTAHLRPVFTEYIAPLLLSPRLAAVVEPLGAPMTPSPTLDATADALLAARGTTVAGRPIWVD